MKKNTPLIILILITFLVKGLDAQTYTSNSSFSDWNGTSAHLGFYLAEINSPLTYVIQADDSITTINPTLLTDGVKFEVYGYLQIGFSNDSKNVNVTVKPGGEFREQLNDFGNFTLTVEDGGTAYLGDSGGSSAIHGVFDLNSLGPNSMTFLGFDATFYNNSSLDIIDGEVSLFGATFLGPLETAIASGHLNVVDGVIDNIFDITVTGGLVDLIGTYVSDTLTANISGGEFNVLAGTFLEAPADLTVNAGELTVEGATFDQTFNTNVLGGTVNIADAAINSTFEILQASNSTINLSGNITAADSIALDISSGTLNIDDATINGPLEVNINNGANVNIGGDLTIIDDIDFNVINGTLGILNASIDGPIDITAGNMGIINLSGNISAVDPFDFNILEGILNINNATLEGLNDVVVNNGGTVNIEGGLTILDSLDFNILNGTLGILDATIGGPIGVSVDDNGVVNIGGNVTTLDPFEVDVSNGTLEILDATIDGPVDITVDDNGNVNIGGTSTILDDFDVDVVNGTLTIQDSSDVTILGPTTIDISPDGTVTVEGDLTITQPPLLTVGGTLDVPGSLTLSDQNSEINIPPTGVITNTSTESIITIGDNPKCELTSEDDLTQAPIIDISYCELLPIQLLGFYATYRSSGHKVDIEWAVATQLNINRYEVLRSTNGTDFSPIYTINDVPNSTQIKRYTYQDELLTSDKNLYYKLRALDNDGRFQDSRVVNIFLGEHEINVSIYPNPAKEQFTIESEFTGGSLEVFDFFGRKVIEQNLTGNSTKVVVDKLSKGTYSIRITNPYGYSSTREIVIQ